MSERPMFSVIIPVYNKADVLAEAISSVLCQTLDAWEAIVVDDGSADDFAGAIAPFENDPRIRVIRQANGGVSAARNAGMALSRAPYIAFLDADDEWLPNHLAEIQRMVEREPGAGMYVTACRVTFPDGSFTENRHYFLQKDIFRVPDLFAYTELLGGKQFANSLITCVTREAVEKCGPFQVGERNGEDTDFILRIAAYFDAVLSDAVTAVYHRERSTATRHGFLNYDWYFQKREAALLSDERIPAAKRENIRVCFDRFRNHKCRHYLLDGNRKQAIAVLSGIGREPALRKARMITVCMLWIPAPVLRFIRRVKKQREQE